MDLPAIQSAWAAEFPGTSILLVVLRAALALADWQARQIQTQFQQLHHDLFQTGLPMAFWDPLTHRTYLLIQRHHTRAQREFRHALAALQSSHKKPEAATPSAKPSAKPSAPPPDPPRKINLYQSVKITVEDGVPQTVIDKDAASLLALPPHILENIGWFTRQFHFPDLIVPACYAHLLTHKGMTFPIKVALFITYPKDDFLRLCRQEIDTNSPIPLDDPNCRSRYGWND